MQWEGKSRGVARAYSFGVLKHSRGSQNLQSPDISD